VSAKEPRERSVPEEAADFVPSSSNESLERMCVYVCVCVCEREREREREREFVSCEKGCVERQH